MRRELCVMFSINCEDQTTPLPTKKLFRSLSMREASRVRNRERLIRNSFLLELNGRREGGKPQPSVGVEGQSLLLSLDSSQESSARSSFSSAGQISGRVELSHWSRTPPDTLLSLVDSLLCHNNTPQGVVSLWHSKGRRQKSF